MQNDGKYNWKGESCYERIYTECQSVSQQIPKLIRIKKSFEMFKAYPGTAPYSFCNFIILECYLYAIEWEVAENDEINEHWN